MKTNYLFKLILLLILCGSLYSCTADETHINPKSQTDIIPAPNDGEPVLTPPRK